MTIQFGLYVQFDLNVQVPRFLKKLKHQETTVSAFSGSDFKF